MTEIAVLGTGNVAYALAGPLAKAGHRVTVGSRAPGGVSGLPDNVAVAGYADAVRAAEVVVNATPGTVSVELLTGLARELSGTVLVDVANAVLPAPDGDGIVLHYLGGSLAEEIQRALPGTRVVKTLNTMHDSIMSAPRGRSGPVSVFVSGDDAGAKGIVTGLLTDLGWPPEWIIDLGGVRTARMPEAFMPMTPVLAAAVGPVFGLAVTR